jgi:hypothetical protein
MLKAIEIENFKAFGRTYPCRTGPNHSDLRGKQRRKTSILQVLSLLSKRTSTGNMVPPCFHE